MKFQAEVIQPTALISGPTAMLFLYCFYQIPLNFIRQERIQYIIYLCVYNIHNILEIGPVCVIRCYVIYI
jgi:hypothetical protein